jgi:hypothetical protein
VQELLDVLGQTDTVVQVLRVLHLVLVELEQQVERVVLDLLLALFRSALEALLELVPDVVPVDGFVADDQTDQVSSVREFLQVRVLL